MTGTDAGPQRVRKGGFDPKFKTPPGVSSGKGQNAPTATGGRNGRSWTLTVSLALAISVYLARRAAALSFAGRDYRGSACHLEGYT